MNERFYSRGHKAGNTFYRKGSRADHHSPLLVLRINFGMIKFLFCLNRDLGGFYGLRGLTALKPLR